MKKVNYDRLPEHMKKGVRRYIEEGIIPGGFAVQALANNFAEATVRADSINRANLDNWGAWLTWECPRDAWGSLEKVDAWIRKGGLNGDKN